MKKVLAFALIFFLDSFSLSRAQVMFLGQNFGSGCTPSALTGATNDWPFWNPGVTCFTSCTNGNGIASVPDVVASLTASQSSSALAPIYTTAGVNGLVVSQYIHTAQHYLATSSSITSGNTTMTWFAVVEFTDFTNDFIMVGNTGATNNNFTWGTSTSGNQAVFTSGGATIGLGSSTLSTGVWYTLVAQYNQPTGAWALYKCSAGTCTSDGSGTQSASFSQPVNTLGYTATILGGDGYIAEIAYYNSTTMANFASYSQCRYGI